MNEELTQLVDQLNSVSQDADDSFRGLTAEQLNWKPSTNEWSVAQCFEHLIMSNAGYLPLIEKIARGEHKSSMKERMPVLPRFFGTMVLKAVQPQSQRKFKAGRGFQPSTSSIGSDIIKRFNAQQAELAERMRSTDGMDLRKIIVTSPVSSFVTYSLLDAFRIVVAHEQRHLAQAKRVTTRDGFPNVSNSFTHHA
ncbi:MAG TPA: DinB family protein [Pyrinomonadaceae bacterium]|jgi:hypothetical protein